MAVKPRLIVLCGLPASGKTTHSKRLADEIKAVRFCPDEWMRALSIDLFDESARGRVEALQWKLAQELLGQGLTVIIEWGSWTRVERDAVREQARKLGAAVELHFLTAPNDVLLVRFQDRLGKTAVITPEFFAEWAAKFEAPTAGELALYDKGIILETHIATT